MYIYIYICIYIYVYIYIYVCVYIYIYRCAKSIGFKRSVFYVVFYDVKSLTKVVNVSFLL